MQRLRHKFAAFWHQARAARDGEEILTAELLAITQICLCEAVCTKKKCVVVVVLLFSNYVYTVASAALHSAFPLTTALVF